MTLLVVLAQLSDLATFVAAQGHGQELAPARFLDPASAVILKAAGVIVLVALLTFSRRLEWRNPALLSAAGLVCAGVGLVGTISNVKAVLG